MAATLTRQEINQFLPIEKLQLADQPDYDAKAADLVVTAKSIVVGKLRLLFNTSSWTDTGTTPPLVKSIMSMLVAGWIFDRQFSDEVAPGFISYGTRLVREAHRLLDELANGMLNLDDDLAVSLRLPTFLETEPVFTMDQRW